MATKQMNEDHVREAAFMIWLNEGQPEGKNEEHWHRAVAQIKGAQTTTRKRATKSASTRTTSAKTATAKTAAKKPAAKRTKTTTTRKTKTAPVN